MRSDGCLIFWTRWRRVNSEGCWWDAAWWIRSVQLFGSFLFLKWSHRSSATVAKLATNCGLRRRGF